MLAVGASARCGEECYIRQLLLVSSASSGRVSLTASAFGLVEYGAGGEELPASSQEAPGKLPEGLEYGVTKGLQSSRGNPTR